MGDSKFEMNRIDSRLSRLYTGSDNKQETYDRWADDYEEDLVGDLGYVAHVDAARIFSEAVPDRACRVLDVACGTGLVGIELQNHGYSDVDGTDFSPGMLEKAADTGTYRTLFRHDFTRDLEKPGQYDALICVGLFAFDIPPITDMIRVIRSARSGGTCVITVNGAAWHQLDHETTIRDEADRYGFTIEAIHRVGYIQGQGIDGRVLVIRAPGDAVG